MSQEKSGVNMPNYSWITLLFMVQAAEAYVHVLSNLAKKAWNMNGIA